MDYFSGAGGMSLGCEQAGFDVVTAVEFDEIHAETHHWNFPQAAEPLVADVAKLDPAAVLRAAGVKPGELDLVIGGPPCQGFSTMGYRDFDDSRNELVGAFARHVLALDPRAFVMENVPGILAGEMRQVLDAALRKLSRRYRIADPIRLLDATQFGVPQKRKRVFVIGIRRDLGVAPRYPTALGESTTVWDALADLPDISHLGLEDDETPYDKPPHSKYARIMRGVERDPQDFSRTRQWNAAICTNCRPTLHKPASVKLYAETRQGETAAVHRLYRLPWQGQSYTLRCGTGRDRGSYTAPRPLHPTENRVITVREAARLHGLPDWFRLHPTKFHGFRQVGNAVVPQVMRAVAAEIRQVLAEADHVAVAV